VLNLLRSLQMQLGLTYVFHQPRPGSRRVLLRPPSPWLYLGQVDGCSPTAEVAVSGRPLHPYSVSLLSAVPVPQGRRAQPAAGRAVARSRSAEIGPRSESVRAAVRSSRRCPVGPAAARSARASAPGPLREPCRSAIGWACHFPGETRRSAPRPMAADLAGVSRSSNLAARVGPAPRAFCRARGGGDPRPPAARPRAESRAGHRRSFAQALRLNGARRGNPAKDRFFFTRVLGSWRWLHGRSAAARKERADLRDCAGRAALPCPSKPGGSGSRASRCPRPLPRRRSR